jgi:hypothetical protein
MQWVITGRPQWTQSSSPSPVRSGRGEGGRLLCRARWRAARAPVVRAQRCARLGEPSLSVGPASPPMRFAAAFPPAVSCGPLRPGCTFLRAPCILLALTPPGANYALAAFETEEQDLAVREARQLLRRCVLQRPGGEGGAAPIGLPDGGGQRGALKGGLPRWAWARHRWPSA